MYKKICLTLLLTFVFLSPSVWAHYLWVSVERNADKAEVVNVYFEESPSAGDGHYLDHFIGTSQTWIRTLSNPNPKLMKLAEVKQKDKR